MKRTLSVLAVTILAAACSSHVGEVEDTTTTTQPQATTTTTVAETTTTTVPPTTTTTLVEADPAEVEVIRTQAHEVVLDFIDRMSRIGKESGRPQLTDTDPYAGAVRHAVEIGDYFNDWATECYDLGRCSGTKSTTYNRSRTLVEAGTDVVVPYGDGTYYVSGLYVPVGAVGIWANYIGGFRFDVEDDRAVLVDMVTWARYAIKRSGSEAGGTWLSGWTFTGEELDQMVKWSDTGLKIRPVVMNNELVGRSYWGSLLLEVTNTTTEEIAIATYPTDLEAEIFRPMTGWARVIEPGETKTWLVRAGVDEKLDDWKTDTVIDEHAGKELFELSIFLPYVKHCEAFNYGAEPEFMPEDACHSIVSLAEHHGFGSHEHADESIG